MTNNGPDLSSPIRSAPGIPGNAETWSSGISTAPGSSESGFSTGSISSVRIIGVIGGSDRPADSPRAFVRDVVVENNHIEHAEKGVWIRDAAAGVLLRGNTTRDVGLPVVTREVLQRIRAEQLAKLSVQKQPIAHWSFDQVTGTAVFDQSPNRFTARVEGAVEFSPEGVRGLKRRIIRRFASASTERMPEFGSSRDPTT